MSATNGTAATPEELRGRLTTARREAKLLEAELRLGQLKRVHSRQKRLMENADAWEWISGFQDVVDRLRGPERDLVLPISTAMDRRYGDNWPFWRTWIEHARYRASSRLVCQMSNQARGALGGLRGYVIGQGYTHRAAAKGDDCPDGLVDAVQKGCLDEFAKHNRWSEREGELFCRDRRDGESFARYFPQDDGMLEVRTVEPSWLLDKGDEIPEVGKYGILTDAEDLETITGFWVCPTGNAGDGEEVPPEELWFSKPTDNRDRIIKRGMPDFTFDAYQMMRSVSRMLEHMVEGGAIQASIAFIRKHEGSSSDQVSGFVGSLADGGTQFDNVTGTTQNVERFYPGKIVDVPAGIGFEGAPFASGTQNWVAIVQAGLRSVATVWNAPEWLISGDASNNNYASSLVAESPFTRYCQGQQGYYRSRFEEVQWKAVRAKCDAGKLKVGGHAYSYDEVRRYVEISSEPPKLTVRDPLQVAQETQLKIQGGWMSVQQACQEDGRDYEQTMQEVEEHKDRTGEGPGDQLAEGDEQQDEQGNPLDQGGGLAQMLGEALVIRDDHDEAIMEAALKGAKFTGQKEVMFRGKKQTWYYRDGRRVANPNAQKPTPKEKPVKLSVDQVHDAIAKAQASGKPPTGEDVAALGRSIGSLTVKEASELKKRLALKASGNKAQVAQKLAERALGGARPAAKPKADPAAGAREKLDAAPELRPGWVPTGAIFAETLEDLPKGLEKQFYASKEAGAEPRTTSVPADAPVVATQGSLNKASVEKYLDNPDAAPEPGQGGKVVLARYKGKTYVLDGHHKLAAARLRGEGSVQAETWDLDQPPADKAPKAEKPKRPNGGPAGGLASLKTRTDDALQKASDAYWQGHSGKASRKATEANDEKYLAELKRIKQEIGPELDAALAKASKRELAEVMGIPGLARLPAAELRKKVRDHLLDGRIGSMMRAIL